MKGNILASLFSTDLSGSWAIPNYYCANGNCTWNNYTSLGICSRCSNVTANLTKNCSQSASSGLSDTQGCSISLSNGFSLGGSANSQSHLMAVGTEFQPLVYWNYSAPLAIIQSITVYNTLFVNASTIFNASECALIPCVISYKGASTIHSPYLEEAGYSGILFYEVANEIWDNFTFDTSATAPWNGPTTLLPALGSSPFRISNDTFTGLKSYLDALLNGFVTVDDNKVIQFTSDEKTRGVVAGTADAMQAIYQNSGPCSDMFGNRFWDLNQCAAMSMSFAMTKAIRDNSFDIENFSSSYVGGVTWVAEQIVLVQWLWLLPIVCLWLFTVLLFILTIRKTSRANLRVWGLNSLALMFISFSGSELDTVMEYDLSTEGLQKRAEKIHVKLELVGNRACFV